MNIFYSILDSIFYEKRFLSLLHQAGFYNKLEGNRISEMFGGTPSHGQDFDVLKLREMYHEKLPNALYYGKKYRVPSKEAAFNFICEILEKYMEEENDHVIAQFTFLVKMASLYSDQQPSKLWQDAIDLDTARRTKIYDEQKKRLPLIIMARQHGEVKYEENCNLLKGNRFPSEAIRVWKAIPKDFDTEYNIAKNNRISLNLVAEWIIVFISKEMVNCIGTALDEPKYRKNVFMPKDTVNSDIRIHFDKEIGEDFQALE